MNYYVKMKIKRVTRLETHCAYAVVFVVAAAVDVAAAAAFDLMPTRLTTSSPNDNIRLEASDGSEAFYDSSSATLEDIVMSDLTPKKAAKKQLKRPNRPLSPCKDSCRLKCKENITQDKREEIFRSYQALSFKDDYGWLMNHTSRVEVSKENKRRRSKNKTKRKSDGHLIYTLPVNDTECVRVCQHFFMSTIGKAKNSNGPILRMMKRWKNGGVMPEKMRGKHERTKEKQVANMIETHILSYKPKVSKKSSSLKSMYDDYMETYGKDPEWATSYSKYARVHIQIRKSTTISETSKKNEHNIDNFDEYSLTLKVDPDDFSNEVDHSIGYEENVDDTAESEVEQGDLLDDPLTNFPPSSSQAELI